MTLFSFAEAILKGLDPESQLAELNHPPSNRRERWTTLISCLQTLEAMSEKQLKEEEWNATEREYLTQGVWRDYGTFVWMGDNGQRPDPKSVGPQIASVATNPNSGEILHVGTGDMAAIYVL